MATLNVGADQSYTTVKEAIAAASAGDTIIIAKGDYSAEGAIYIDKTLTLQADGAEVMRVRVPEDSFL